MFNQNAPAVTLRRVTVPPPMSVVPASRPTVVWRLPHSAQTLGGHLTAERAVDDRGVAILSPRTLERSVSRSNIVDNHSLSARGEVAVLKTIP